MKLEELQKVSLTAKQPEKDVNDKQWQDYFKVMKVMTKQSNETRMSNKTTPILINGYGADEQFLYKGDTQWEIYVKFINDVLSNIRRGEFDYCFYIYQIAELLRFEHERLRTMWRPEDKCFQVWLEF